MSDVQFSKQVRRADRLSKTMALIAAIAVFGFGWFTTNDINLSSIAAAGVGIGVRFVVPYRASMSLPEEERESIRDHPAAGDYNHGAVGGALIVGSGITVPLMDVLEDSGLALMIGGAVIVVTYAFLWWRLPSE